MKTATLMGHHLNLRQRRAEVLTHHLLRRLEPYLVEGDYRHAQGTIMELLMDEGIEILTDHDRQQHGLPPRGPEGWTPQELAALEARRLDALMGTSFDRIVCDIVRP